MKSYKELIDDIFYILDSEIHSFKRSNKLDELKKIHGSELIIKILTETIKANKLKLDIDLTKKEVFSKIIEEERNLKLNNLFK